MKIKYLIVQRFFLISGLIFLFLLSLSACISDNSPSEILRDLLGKHKFSPEVEEELSRFENAYYNVVPNGDESKLEYFRFAFKRLKSNYVKPIQDRKLIDHAISGLTPAVPNQKRTFSPQEALESALRKMLASLDPHSAFMNAEEFRDSFSQTKGEFGGLGIQVTMEDGLVKVIAPIEDTPASRAGVKAGDLISHINNLPVKGMTLAEAVRLMRGLPGSSIHLRLRRDNVLSLDISIVRAIIKVKAIRWKTEGDVGYIRIIRFSERTRPGLQNAISQIKSALGERLKGVVLDLRNNPGGLLDQSVQVTDDLLNDGEIVSIRGRTRSNQRSYFAEKGDLLQGTPIVVLINRGSASASEIVASALQYHERAVVMGTRSFGKGSVQTIMPLPIEGALRLTTALYYSPSGDTIQAFGVTPDIILAGLVKKDKLDNDKSAEQREADLPGAIKGTSSARLSKKPVFSKILCPPIGESKDRALGCALVYLDAGSIAEFKVMMSNRS